MKTWVAAATVLCAMALSRTAWAQEECSCDDIPPPTGHSCEQQREWGKCSAVWMALGNYCQTTCGRCNCPNAPLVDPSIEVLNRSDKSECPCTDKIPPGGHSCGQQKSWGKCTSVWMIMGDFCQTTCGRCTCPPVDPFEGMSDDVCICTDQSPPDGPPCEQWKSEGKCSDAEITSNGYCAMSCGRCICPPSSTSQHAVPAMEPDAEDDGLDEIDTPSGPSSDSRSGPSSEDEGVNPDSEDDAGMPAAEDVSLLTPDDEPLDFDEIPIEDDPMGPSQGGAEDSTTSPSSESVSEPDAEEGDEVVVPESESDSSVSPINENDGSKDGDGGPEEEDSLSPLSGAADNTAGEPTNEDDGSEDGDGVPEEEDSSSPSPGPSDELVAEPETEDGDEVVVSEAEVDSPVNPADEEDSTEDGDVVSEEEDSLSPSQGPSSEPMAGPDSENGDEVVVPGSEVDTPASPADEDDGPEDGGAVPEEESPIGPSAGPGSESAPSPDEEDESGSVESPAGEADGPMDEDGAPQNEKGLEGIDDEDEEESDDPNIDSEAGDQDDASDPDCACEDIPPPQDFTCEEHKSLGNCDEDFMVDGEFCLCTCDRCTVRDDATEDP